MFDLHITCTKDISFLKINFADRSSAEVEHTPDPSDQPIHKLENTLENDKNYQFLKDLDTNDTILPASELPKIDEPERPVNVASELQRLDI